ncbi:HNH endonuclease [Kineosporia sp. NBRC 101731]|uniref:HNH endonuclease n=1 Tax=Kineosporia sp. NBRC 101731 TaxID=3032199 RepID=UPI0024A40AD7|nr:HNH endonuclease [Kineosporia sp. NBRC 101731]GLY32066.1 hypothetical protein Kisp02_54310 [Kineosporia sp. NBRC 101731]
MSATVPGQRTDAEMEAALGVVLNHCTARSTTKVVCMILAATSEPPTIAEIADMANVHERGVRRALRELEESGDIRLVERSIRGRPNVYEIALQCLPGCRGADHVIEPERSAKAKGKAVISPSLRRKVHERDFYRCLGCGTHLDLTCDHVIPESRGGKTELDNLQTLCMPCNLDKGVLSQDEWSARRAARAIAPQLTLPA